MKTLLCFCLLLGSVLSLAPPFDPPFENFYWNAYGSFVGNGTYYFKFLYPIAPPPTSNPGFLALDDVNKRYFLSLVPPSSAAPLGVFQLAFANGTYFMEEPQTCYFNPGATYNDFLVTYTSATSRNPGLLKNYVGLINDPATCTTQAAVSILRDFRGVIEQYNSDSFVNFAFGACVPGKIASALVFDSWKFTVPPASLFTLPTACYSATDYCAAFIPPGCSLVTPV